MEHCMYVLPKLFTVQTRSYSRISQKVRCRRGHVVDRDVFQELLSNANPKWKQFVDDMDSAGNQPRTNPDGDVSAASPFRERS